MQTVLYDQLVAVTGDLRFQLLFQKSSHEITKSRPGKPGWGKVLTIASPGPHDRPFVHRPDPTVPFTDGENGRIQFSLCLASGPSFTLKVPKLKQAWPQDCLWLGPPPVSGSVGGMSQEFQGRSWVHSEIHSLFGFKSLSV